MLDINPNRLPTSDELPDSDETPVDNEDQNLLPNILLLLLTTLWAERMDWYFGVDMGIYHRSGDNPRIPVVPDGFLSLGVERRKGGKSRRSYVTWEENEVVPILVLEIVSQEPGGEYGQKLNLYARLGVLYYVIYNPEFARRDGHHPFEVYKLTQGKYRLQADEPVWMPEVGLGIGRCVRSLGNVVQEQLGWFDAASNLYPTDAERAEQEHQRAEQEHQRAEQERQRAEQERQQRKRLEDYMRAQGIDPDQV